MDKKQENQEDLTYLGLTRQFNFEPEWNELGEKLYKLTALFTVYSEAGCHSKSSLYEVAHEYSNIPIERDREEHVRMLNASPLKLRPYLSLLTLKALSDSGADAIASLYSKELDDTVEPETVACILKFSSASLWQPRIPVSLRMTVINSTQTFECQPPGRKLPGYNLNFVELVRVFQIIGPVTSNYLQLGFNFAGNEYELDEPLQQVTQTHWPALDVGTCNLQQLDTLNGSIWTSWYCEPGPYGSWSTRTLHFSKANASSYKKGWEMRYTYYFDPDCNELNYGVLIQGLHSEELLNAKEDGSIGLIDGLVDDAVSLIRVRFEHY
ncbi:hypothetical protein Ciccas_012131, partial [Cichlidogyrus casuarinus]